MSPLVPQVQELQSDGMITAILQMFDHVGLSSHSLTHALGTKFGLGDTAAHAAEVTRVQTLKAWKTSEVGRILKRPER
jgi:hypothetical protein